MADRWMDERDRERRQRDWHRSEDYGRDERDRRYAGEEDRSWSGSDRDRVFGERETGMSYGGEDYDAGDYERERRGQGGGRTSAYRGEGERYGRGRYAGGYGGGYGEEYGGEGRAGWQDPGYGGVSPAMQQGEYDAERRAERYERDHGYEGRGYGGRGAGRRDWDDGGRYYGDSGREAIYREEWSQGRRDYGPAPGGYDAGRGSGGRYDRDWEERRAREYSTGRMASGGTGGYDYERGYGDAGRQRYPEGRFGLPPDQGRERERERRREDEDRGQRFERGGREAGDFLRRAGERVAAWFGGGERERQGEERGFRREADRGRGFQGMGPKGYQRPDERIDEEAHERLTDDPWLDASNVSVSVSGGEVTLSGTVENREAKHRAERLVEEISGVRHVQNNLRVEAGNPLTTPSRGYGDSVLQSQMREAETKAPPGATDGGSASAGSSTRTAGSASTDTDKAR